MYPQQTLTCLKSTIETKRAKYVQSYNNPFSSVSIIDFEQLNDSWFMKNYDQKQSCTGAVLITCSENFHKIPKKASALEPFIKKDSSLGDSLYIFRQFSK